MEAIIKDSKEDYVPYSILENMDPADKRYVGIQQNMETLFNKNQKAARIKREFNIPKFKEMVDRVDLELEFCLDLVTQITIHRATKCSVLVGILYRHFQTETTLRVDAMQLCADALVVAAEHDFIDYNTEKELFTQRLHLTRNVMNEIDRYQFPLPMVVSPMTIRCNRDNGYLTSEGADALIVLQGHRANGYYREAEVCADHLNRMNRVPLALNLQVVNLINNKWSSLDKRKPDETPEDYDKRVKAFKRYDYCSKDVVAAISFIRGKFWLTHKYDRRGRVYCRGYHINYQGNEWNKACVEFANKELIE